MPESRDRLDAVLPLAAADVERARLLFRTLEQFFEPLRTCYVIVPDEQLAAVRPALPRGRYSLVAESDVVPEIGYFRTTARARAKLRIVGPPIHGWYVQQLVKLAAAALVSTRFYVTLDADVVCVRPTAYDDLVVDGRALVQTTPPNHPEWNDDAERVLALPRSDRQYAVTPALISPRAVGALAAYLERRVHPSLRTLASNVPRESVRDVLASWRAFLLRSLPWTEYALYHTFLEQTALFPRYHVFAEDDAIYANCVWMASQFDDWDPRAEGAHRFSVVQSAARIPVEHVAARVDSGLLAAS